MLYCINLLHTVIGDGPVDAHHSVFERLDHSNNSNSDKKSSQHKATSGTTAKPQITDFEDKLHRVALTAVMECLRKQNTTPSSNKSSSIATPTRKSLPNLPELRQTDVANAKPDTFDKLTEINTSRERHKVPSPQLAKKGAALSPSGVPRKVKLRMDTVSNTNQGRGRSDIMTRLGKQSVSVFTRLNS